jgi:hypothetical protein
MALAVVRNNGKLMYSQFRIRTLEIFFFPIFDSKTNTYYIRIYCTSGAHAYTRQKQ